MKLNNWDKESVERLESEWGDKYPPFILDMYDFAIKYGTSWLDLGCGFGRFLQYLDSKVDSPDYIGYDSSPAMISRIHERFPEYLYRTFHKDITKPLSHPQQCIVISAIFMHTKPGIQQTILHNISELHPKPKHITFDILDFGQRKPPNEFISRIIKGNFLRIVQSIPMALEMINKAFADHYKVTYNVHKLSRLNNRVVFFLSHE